MTAIYGDQWFSRRGSSHNDNGEISETAKEWQTGLAGLTPQQIKSGFEVMVKQAAAVWPPNVIEFRKFCLRQIMETIPTLEVVLNVLLAVRDKPGSIKDRYQHPLIFSIANGIDMYGLRTLRTVTALKLIQPVYERLLQQGYPDWPDYAQTEQKALPVAKKPPDLEKRKRQFAAMREKLQV